MPLDAGGQITILIPVNDQQHAPGSLDPFTGRPASDARGGAWDARTGVCVGVPSSVLARFGTGRNPRRSR